MACCTNLDSHCGLVLKSQRCESLNANIKAKHGQKLQKTSASISYLGDHMLMLNSFSNSVKFPNHLVVKKNQHKYLQIAFHPDDFSKGRWSHTVSPAPLENIQTPQSCPLCILMICGGTESQECDCVHLCQHTSTGLHPKQLWAEPEVGSAIVNQDSLNLLIHPILHHPSIHPATHLSTHPHIPHPTGP